MFKNIEPDYYGFRDEEDDAQLHEEQEVEAALQKAAMEEWNRTEAERKSQVAALVRVCLALPSRNTQRRSLQTLTVFFLGNRV